MRKSVIIILLIGLISFITLIRLRSNFVNQPKSETIFLEFSSPPPPIFTLGFAGEIILARDVATKINQYRDYQYPFYQVASLTSLADLFFATLEAPLSGKNIPCGKDCMRFVGDSQVIEGLNFAGIDVVSLAANHIMDGGDKALKETMELLDENNIGHTGAGLTLEEANKPLIKEVKGTKLGFLAYNDVYPLKNTAIPDDLSRDIAILKQKVDLVMVAFHWGTEYTDKPGERQIELAHEAVEAGADLIIGDHPHWIQSIEFYKDKPIFYSVGNFVFDQMWSLETRQGIMVFCEFQDKKITKIKIRPFLIEDFSQPQPLEGSAAELIMEKIFSISDPESVTILKLLM